MASSWRKLDEMAKERMQAEEDRLLESKISLKPAEMIVLSQLQSGVCDEEELIIPSPGAHLTYETMISLQGRGYVRKEDEYRWGLQY